MISDDLAELLEIRREKTGQATLDDVAVALIAEGLLADPADEDHNAGYSDEELKALIAEGRASGVFAGTSAAEVSAEVRRRFAARSA